MNVMKINERVYHIIDSYSRTNETEDVVVYIISDGKKIYRYIMPNEPVLNMERCKFEEVCNISELKA
jgi:hypothetical protein